MLWGPISFRQAAAGASCSGHAQSPRFGRPCARRGRRTQALALTMGLSPGFAVDSFVGFLSVLRNFLEVPSMGLYLL